MADASTTKIDFSLLPTVVAVVGSREYPHLGWVDNAVSRMNIDTIIVSGGAVGVDAQAKKSAEKHKLRYKEFAVEKWEWKLLGKRVAYVRNVAIVAYTVAFGGHVLIFAVEENGALTSGSQLVWDICKELKADHTVINHKGEVVWSTYARFARNHETNQ